MTITDAQPNVQSTEVPEKISVPKIDTRVRTTFQWREEALKRISRETGCYKWQARLALRWLDKRVQKARIRRGTVHPRGWQMAGPSYRIVSVVMPHDQQEMPGTAHEAITGALLNSRKGECTLLHHQTGEGGGRRYCAYTVGIKSV